MHAYTLVLSFYTWFTVKAHPLVRMVLSSSSGARRVLRQAPRVHRLFWFPVSGGTCLDKRRGFWGSVPVASEMFTLSLCMRYYCKRAKEWDTWVGSLELLVLISSPSTMRSKIGVGWGGHKKEGESQNEWRFLIAYRLASGCRAAFLLGGVTVLFFCGKTLFVSSSLPRAVETLVTITTCYWGQRISHCTFECSRSPQSLDAFFSFVYLLFICADNNDCHRVLFFFFLSFFFI